MHSNDFECNPMIQFKFAHPKSLETTLNASFHLILLLKPTSRPITFSVHHMCFTLNRGKMLFRKTETAQYSMKFISKICASVRLNWKTAFYVNASLKLYCLAIIFIGFWNAFARVFDFYFHIVMQIYF